MRALTIIFLLSALARGNSAKDDCINNDIPFQACAPIGAYYPPPTIDKSSKPFKKLASQFTETFDNLIKNGGSDKYGPITLNTTSFSVVIFGGAESLEIIPSSSSIIIHPLKIEHQTQTSLRTPNFQLAMYLPELSKVKGPLTVNWEDITIGALAGQMSGLSRESGACVVGKACDWKKTLAFQNAFVTKAPYFLPDTTPVVSYAAFQLLVFAMQRSDGGNWPSILDKTILQPLSMSDSGVLSHGVKDIFAMKSLNTSAIGEPGALSFVSSAKDLARAGHSILASDLLSPAITRRWLHPNIDTSNLRNGVGRPWEVYRAGNAISPILYALTKSGTIGKYVSYFGLSTDFNAGFSILAHDNSVEDRKLDLNVHADIASEVLGYLQTIAAEELEARYAGSYSGKSTEATFNTTDKGRGLEVQKLVIGGVNIKKQTAQKLGIHADDLDFRIYPTNVQDGSRHQFIAVFQDKSAPIDMGTPTCITWQEIGADAEITFVFTLGRNGEVVGVEVPQLHAKMKSIPDFRGPEGAWTLRAQGRARTGKATSTLQAIPTPTHMALVELQNQGVLKYLVSQNCDGLHRRSGILRDRISELHGNSNRECCKDCGKEYIRDFRAVASYEKSVHDHRTGRKCTACGGNLLDTIINFGEFLPEEPLKLARSHAKKADLCIALGSSLSVPPASGIPETCGKSKKSKLVICNLQETFMEGLADMHVWAESDVLMTRVMDRLGYSIPNFILQRRLVIKMQRDAHGRQVIALTGVDDDGTPVTYLQSVKLEDSRRIVRSEPFSFVFRDGLSTGAEVKFALEFMGHYNEPNVVIDYSVPDEEGAETVYDLSYDPSTGEWVIMR
ncbi:hypothetical protein FPHYL_10351 [Fusarium phyllophilum]|uniref:protein acetyllysine N-acetyltransferase n=2 Tax=Fusarium fujikuroi species complex TaxID=171627 RepID=A0A8H5MZQ8_9HYPO|nr:hypothetical protein FPHYL_10351 [Fusarium phyllophilum]